MLEKLIPNQPADLRKYWQERAKKYGKNSVLNMAHGVDEFEVVTKFQKQFLFPLLKAELEGWETEALDFGCGPGRFTVELAELVGGRVTGVDITPELLELAPTSPAVEYYLIDSNELPFTNALFDLVWCCLVLGGIPNENIKFVLAEIDRVLKPGGLFFFVENTACGPDAKHWFFRSEEAYIQLASFCNPRVLVRYEDVGQPITVFSGRKKPGNHFGLLE